jgi:hypothetical protein
MNGKPQQTAADVMVIALSPILIMALVGSLCFFLVEVFYQGPVGGMARWVMFWYVIAIVLIPRIAIENTSEHAGVYGLALAASVWLVLIRTSPSWVLSMVLLAVVWFCANKLVWDCTLIDDEEDSSGQGLLQKAPREPEVKTTSKTKRKRIVSSSPGRWVVYFSLLALPLFGIGQVLLPKDASGSRRWGLAFLVVYMAAALGLLVTTSFLGLRRYLRQRYMRMPVSIALAWVKFGGGIAVLVLVGALFVPRPGGNAFWSAARRQADYRLHQASEYASGRNPHGEGEGKAGDASGANTGEKRADGGTGPPEKSPSGPPQPGQGAPAPSPPRGPTPADPALHLYALFRIALICAAAALVCWWLVRSRGVLLEMLRAGWVAVRDFFRRLLDLMPARKPVRPVGLDAPRRPQRPLAEFKNPFFAEKGSSRPPEEIILYTYDALQAWTREQGVEPRPEQTAREFCEESGERLPELVSSLRQLSFLYAHAAYGERLPAECNLEPLKEIWAPVDAAVINQFRKTR